MSLAAVHKQLTEKKWERDVPEDAGECPRVLSQQQRCAVMGHIPVTGGGGTLLAVTWQLATASAVCFSRSGFFESVIGK